MSTTFADYAAQEQARQSIADAVLLHTYTLCEALKHNYVEYAIRGHQKYVDDQYHQRNARRLRSRREAGRGH